WVAAGGNLASRDRALDDGPPLLPDPAHEMLSPDCGQFRITLNLGDETRNCPAAGKACQRDPIPSRVHKIALQAARVRGRLGGQDCVEDGVEGEGSLAGPSPVDGGL